MDVALSVTDVGFVVPKPHFPSISNSQEARCRFALLKKVLLWGHLISEDRNLVQPQRKDAALSLRRRDKHNQSEKQSISLERVIHGWS